MKVRFGTYTIIEGIEMLIFGNRNEVPMSEEEKTFGISYPFELGMKKGFKKSPYGNEYYKVVYLREITNAFFVITKANYKGYKFEVEPYFGDEIHLHLATKDLELGKKLGFYEIHDGYGKPYYLGEIKISEVDKIWEERTKSVYDIPLPNGLELIKEISRGSTGASL